MGSPSLYVKLGSHGGGEGGRSVFRVADLHRERPWCRKKDYQVCILLMPCEMPYSANILLLQLRYHSCIHRETVAFNWSFFSSGTAVVPPNLSASLIIICWEFTTFMIPLSMADHLPWWRKLFAVADFWQLFDLFAVVRGGYFELIKDSRGISRDPMAFQ